MSYAGMVHDTLWDVFETNYSDIDWRIRSKMIDDVIQFAMPLFEHAVLQQGRNEVANAVRDWLRNPQAITLTDERN